MVTFSKSGRIFPACKINPQKLNFKSSPNPIYPQKNLCQHFNWTFRKSNFKNVWLVVVLFWVHLSSLTSCSRQELLVTKPVTVFTSIEFRVCSCTGRFWTTKFSQPSSQEKPYGRADPQKKNQKNQPHLNKQINEIPPQSHRWSSKNQGKRDLKEMSVPKTGHWRDSHGILSNYCFFCLSRVKLAEIFGAVFAWTRKIHLILTSYRIPKWK